MEGSQIDLLRSISSLLTSYWQTQAVFAAVKINFFDKIGSNGKKISDLSTELLIPEKRVRLLIKALISLDLVTIDDENLIYLTEKGEFFKSEHSFSMVPATYVWAESHYLTWKELDKAIMTGEEQFSKVFGSKFFDWLSKNPREAEFYYQAMEIYAYLDYQPLLNTFKFRKNDVITDVGGGYGTLAKMLIEKNPEITLQVFDLPEVTRLALKKIRNTIFEKKIVFVSGDFFKDPIPKSDHIILSRVIHDWNDKDALKILNSCYDGLSQNGQLHVIERPLAPSLKDDWGALLNLNMLVITGSNERTTNEYLDLFQKAHFQKDDMFIAKNSGITHFILKKA